MALVANGSRLSWDAYQFACRDPNGTIYRHNSLEEAQADADANDGEVVMRAVYVTGWIETIDAPDEEW